MIQDDFSSLPLSPLYSNFMDVSRYDELSSFMMNVQMWKRKERRKRGKISLFPRKEKILFNRRRARDHEDYWLRLFSCFSLTFLHFSFLLQTNLSLHHHKAFIFSFLQGERNKNRKRRKDQKLYVSDDAVCWIVSRCVREDEENVETWKEKSFLYEP